MVRVALATIVIAPSRMVNNVRRMGDIQVCWCVHCICGLMLCFGCCVVVEERTNWGMIISLLNIDRTISHERHCSKDTRMSHERHVCDLMSMRANDLWVRQLWQVRTILV